MSLTMTNEQIFGQTFNEDTDEVVTNKENEQSTRLCCITVNKRKTKMLKTG